MSDILKIEIGPAGAGFFRVRASFRGSPVGVDVARPRNLLKHARTIAVNRAGFAGGSNS
jgi:hypothetical protein